MPSSNYVSATLTPADVTAITQAIDTIRTKLPFLVAIPADERRRLFKMGDGSRPFVEDTLGVAQAHPETVPAAFDTAEFARDAALWDALAPIGAKVTELSELIDQTTTGLGADLMGAAVQVYGQVQASRAPGLEAVRTRLAGRFQKTRGVGVKTAPRGALRSEACIVDSAAGRVAVSPVSDRAYKSLETRKNYSFLPKTAEVSARGSTLSDFYSTGNSRRSTLSGFCLTVRRNDSMPSQCDSSVSVADSTSSLVGSRSSGAHSRLSRHDSRASPGGSRTNQLQRICVFGAAVK